MKKILLIGFLIISPIFCFAQESIEIFAGSSFFTGNLENDGRETLYTENTSITFGFGGFNFNIFKNDKVGFYYNLCIIMPTAFVHKFNDENISYEQDNIDTALNLSIGIILRVFNTGNFIFPVTFGLHWFSIEATAEPSLTTSSYLQQNCFGYFASVGAELHVNETIYIFLRMQGNLDVFIMTNRIHYTGVAVGDKTAYFIDQKTYNKLGVYTMLTPFIGVGIKTNGFFKK